MDKDCYCIDKRKVITYHRYQNCFDCFSCETRNFLDKFLELSYVYTKDWRNEMNKLIRIYEREDKLKRILNGI